jgi:hypothetical protein
MARGWESKSVEEQMTEAQAKSPDENRKKSSPEEMQRQQKIRGLELTLSKIKSDLAACTNERHRAMLEAAQQELKRQLEGFNP